MPYSKKVSFSYNNEIYNLDNIISPSKCPMCHHAIEPVPIAISIDSEIQGSFMFFCKACSSSFISYFDYFVPSMNNRYVFEFFTRHEPVKLEDIKFEKIIAELSPRFILTFNQSYFAEQLNLKEICGMGYRKALEILIKDYAISKNPTDEEIIRNPKYSLSDCINDFIADHRIKNPSIGASWIGNDETHYTRRHEDKDISDLKALIQTVVYFVQFDLLVDNATKFIGT